MRMLCWPARLPLSASSRLPGGKRNSSSLEAASSWVSLRRAVLRIVGGNSRGLRPCQRAAVDLSAKDRITGECSNMHAYRASCQASICMDCRNARDISVKGRENWADNQTHVKTSNVSVPESLAGPPVRVWANSRSRRGLRPTGRIHSVNTSGSHRASSRTLIGRRSRRRGPSPRPASPA
jgi:hypothetical protein